MSEQENRRKWVLVKCADLPKPSTEELEVLRRRWVNALVWFYTGSDRWQSGKVYEITQAGEVKIAVRHSDAWIPRKVIRFEYIPRVLRLA